MTPNEEFEADPAVFRAKYAVVVVETPTNVLPSVRYFVFVKGKGDEMTLKSYSENAEGRLAAYWLPWKTLDIMSMNLGGDANFFFTSQMTNCRFTVLTDNTNVPKVAHLAGTWTATKRDAEELKLKEATELERGTTMRARSLSVSDKDKSHDYRGQDKPDPSSAFVYGVRNSQTSTWSFGAQVVKGMMPRPFPEKAAVQADIKRPFSFQ
ncbi:MAG: hypothetical protein ABJD97_04180 [Betaproteobacteria bacterium]